MLSDPEFWVAVAFVLFVALIVWKGMKPLLAALDVRANRIRLQIEETRSLRAEAERALGEANRKVREAKSEAEAILTHAQAEVERLKVQAVESLEASLKRREDLALQRIAQAEQQAAADVRTAAVDVAIAATERLLREKLDGAKGDALIDQAIKELPSKLH